MFDTVVPSIMLGIAEFVNLLVQMLYLIGSVLLMLLDFVQDVFRRLAGLSAQPGANTTEGDILLDIFKSKQVMDAFASLIIVGMLLLFLFTIIQFIRIEYTSEGAKNSRGNIISQALKSLVMFLIVPISCIAGIILSNQLLRILDNATSTYAGTTISGQIFKISAYDANPIRAGESKLVNAGPAIDGHGSSGNFQKLPYFMEIDNWDYEIKLRVGEERYSYRVDKGSVSKISGLAKAPVYLLGNFYTFYNNFAVKFEDRSSKPTPPSFTFKTIAILPSNIDTVNVSGDVWGEALASRLDSTFSLRTSKAIGDNGSLFYKTQIKAGDGLNYTNYKAVFYFYNLNDINYFLMYLAGWFALKSLLFVCFGLIMRLYMVIILFVISPPIIAMAPIDNGSALSKWRGKFIGQVLSAYGTVVGLNLFFDIVNVINKIEIFKENSPSVWMNFTAGFYNNIFQLLVVLVGCLMIKNFNGVISQLIGAEDAMSSGAQMKKEVDDNIKKAATTAGRVGGVIATGGALAIGAGMSMSAKMQAGLAYNTAGEKEEAIQSQKLSEKTAAKEKMDTAKQNLTQDLNKTSQQIWGRNYNELDEGEKELIRDDLERSGSSSLADFKAAEDASKIADRDYEGAKADTLKAKQAAVSENPNLQKRYLKGETLKSRGRNVVSAHINNATPIKAFNDYTGKMFTAQGTDAVYKEFASRNELTEQITKDYTKARSDKKEEKSKNNMGSIADSVEGSNAIATAKATSASYEQQVHQTRDSQNKEVVIAKDSLQHLADLYKRANDKEQKALASGDNDGVNRARQQKEESLNDMYKVMNGLKSNGTLSDDSQVALSSVLDNLDNNGITIEDFKTQIESKFETRIDAVFEHANIKEELNKLQTAIKSDSVKAMATALSNLEKKFAIGGVRMQSVEEISKAIEQATKDQKSQGELLKKLGESMKK